MFFTDIGHLERKILNSIQLEMLLEVDRICKKNKIQYQLAEGTLLGAIRHKGFIPWDDDIDIWMLRNDYNQFIAVCEKELSEKYFLQTIDTDPCYLNHFLKIRRNNSLFLTSVCPDTKMHKGIYIDIFPLDNVKPKTFSGKIQYLSTILITGLYVMKKLDKLYKSYRKRSIKRYLCYLSFYLLKVIPDQVFVTMQKKVINDFNNEETEYVTQLLNNPKENYYKHMIKRTDFYDTIEGNFEGYKFPIPKNYDKILLRLYGNYNEYPPVHKQKSHHGLIKLKFPESDIVYEYKVNHKYDLEDELCD